MNITPRNLERVFVPTGHVAVYGAVVEAFNQASAARVAAEDALEAESNRKQEDEAQRLLQHDALRHASTELSYLSQRQVVHRNPPVRPDASAASASDGSGTSTKATKSSKTKKKDSESATGLGKWEWSRLVQRKPTSSSATGRSTASSSVTETASASQALPASRFTALLSRQIATKRRCVFVMALRTSAGARQCANSVVCVCRSSDIGASSSAVVIDDTSDGRARVRFAEAPEVVEIAPRPPMSSADVSENEEVAECDDLTPQPAPVRAASASSSSMAIGSRVGVQSTRRIDDLDDDEDDDW